MMDLLKFIDSPDVRLFNRNHQFTPAEWAVLISHSQCTTVQEKLEALHYLVDTFPTEEFGSERLGRNMVVWGQSICWRAQDFRKNVQGTISVWEGLLQDCQARQENIVYAASLTTVGDKLYDGNNPPALFNTYDKAMAYLTKEQLDCKALSGGDDGETLQIYACIDRLHVDAEASWEHDRLWLDGQLRLVKLEPKYERYQQNPMVEGILNAGYWVDVPLPFQVCDEVEECDIFDKGQKGRFLEGLPDDLKERILKEGLRADACEMYVQLLPAEPKSDFLDEEESRAFGTRLVFNRSKAERASGDGTLGVRSIKEEKTGLPITARLQDNEALETSVLQDGGVPITFGVRNEDGSFTDLEELLPPKEVGREGVQETLEDAKRDITLTDILGSGKRIMLELESCEEYIFEPEDFKELELKEVELHHDHLRTLQVRMCIRKEANTTDKIRLFAQDKPFQRLLQYNDIVGVAVGNRRYFIPWIGESEFENAGQHGHINDEGDLVITTTVEVEDATR